MSNAQKKPKKGLGRGLSALISQQPVSVVPPKDEALKSTRPNLKSPSASVSQAIAKANEQHSNDAKSGESATATERIRYVEIGKITNNPKQPRQVFKPKEIEELAESIKTLGVLQPILVRKTASPDSFEIVAGERRWRASKTAGLKQVPVIIRDIDDRLSLEIAIVENVQRSNLSPIEEAEAYRRLIDEFNLSQKQVADKVGKDRTTVSNALRLLHLPTEILSLLAKEKITVGHAKAILTVKEPSAQISLAKKVLAENLSVRALENIVARVVVLDTGKKGDTRESSKKSQDDSSGLPELVDRLRHSLGTKVAIKHQPSGRGKITIEYFSEEELDRLIDKLS